MTFRVGQIVECINSSVGFATGRPVSLQLHARYTVLDSEHAPGQYLLLVETGVTWFSAKRFRPIIERKTSISFAHEILRNVSRKEKVRA